MLCFIRSRWSDYDQSDTPQHLHLRAQLIQNAGLNSCNIYAVHLP